MTKRTHILAATLSVFLAGCQPAADPGTDRPARGGESDATTAAEIGPGLVTVESAVAFEETYDRLRAAIEDNANLRILAEVDHGANARATDRQLPPTRLILFGNPNLGTPLMEAARTTAIDLPQKLLIWEDAEGRVLVTYNDPGYLARRHGIEGQDPVLNTITGALASLAGVVE